MKGTPAKPVLAYLIWLRHEENSMCQATWEEVVYAGAGPRTSPPSTHVVHYSTGIPSSILSRTAPG